MQHSIMINIFWLTDHVISSSTKSRRKDLVADKQQSIPFLNIRSLSQMIRRLHTFQQGHGGLIPTAPLPDFRVNPHQLVPEYTQLCNFFKKFFNAPQRDGKRLITFLVREKNLEPDHDSGNLPVDSGGSRNTSHDTQRHRLSVYKTLAKSFSHERDCQPINQGHPVRT